MFVTLLSRDDGLPVVGPTVGEVERAVRALDGEMHSMVVLGTNGPAHMAIGGGGTRWIAFATLDGESFSVLKDPLVAAGSVRLVAGGEVDEYPAQETVDVETAARAARTFALGGVLDARLTWEEMRRSREE
jgi:hypothetical protein